MSKSYFHEGYLAGLKFAAEMLELDGNTKAVETLQAIIDAISNINIEKETK